MTYEYQQEIKEAAKKAAEKAKPKPKTKLVKVGKGTWEEVTENE